MTWRNVALAGRAAAVLVLLQIAVGGQARPVKPKVPVGIDPGGTAVGLITRGIDYTSPAVARCLARDGEGLLIAWDVVAREPSPFAPQIAGVASDSDLVSAVACDGKVRIVAVRIDPDDGVSVSRALAFLATTPARIVVLPQGNQPRDWLPFRRAAVEFERLLIVVEVSAQQPQSHPVSDLVNVVVAMPSSDRVGVSMLAEVATFVSCVPQTRDPSLNGAALKSLFQSLQAAGELSKQLSSRSSSQC